MMPSPHAPQGPRFQRRRFPCHAPGDSVVYNGFFPAELDLLGLSAAAHARIDDRSEGRLIAPDMNSGDVALHGVRFRGTHHVFGFLEQLVKLSPHDCRAGRAMRAPLPDAAIYARGAATDVRRRRPQDRLS